MRVGDQACAEEGSRASSPALAIGRRLPNGWRKGKVFVTCARVCGLYLGCVRLRVIAFCMMRRQFQPWSPKTSGRAFNTITDDVTTCALLSAGGGLERWSTMLGTRAVLKPALLIFAALFGRRPVESMNLARSRGTMLPLLSGVVAAKRDTGVSGIAL